jgi:hypothetical protein
VNVVNSRRSRLQCEFTLSILQCIHDDEGIDKLAGDLKVFYVARIELEVCGTQKPKLGSKTNLLMRWDKPVLLNGLQNKAGVHYQPFQEFWVSQTEGEPDSHLSHRTRPGQVGHSVWEVDYPWTSIHGTLESIDTLMTSGQQKG